MSNLIETVSKEGYWIGDFDQVAPFLPRLGTPIKQKGDASFNDLIPYSRENAPAGSLSSITGFDEQPMHTDSAFDPNPPRILVLWCVHPGESRCPTKVGLVDHVGMRLRYPLMEKTHWVV